VSEQVAFKVAKTVDEILQLEPLAAEALTESRFGIAAFSRSKFQKVAQQAAENQSRYGVLVATLRGKPVGFLYCAIGEPLVGEGVLITTVHVLFVPPSLRGGLLGGKVANGLLNGVLSWSKSRNGKEVLLHLTSGVHSARTHRFLNRRGFVAIGGSYAR